MHDGFQIGTIAVILFGIMLNRYDTSGLRREMRKHRSDLRAEVHRSTTLVKKLLFGPMPNAPRS